MIPYGRQSLDADDKEAVLRVLDSDFLTQGPEVPDFESALNFRVGSDYAVAMTSATSALHLSCLALEVGPGDKVWTSAISFVASANCAVYCGADVEFVDVDCTTGNMSILALRTKLREAHLAGELPKVVIPVHFAGQPVNMAEIARLGEEFGFKIIEDASHALGASYLGEPVGSCRYSDITVFSFHPVKMITTAEGGSAHTNNAILSERLRNLRSHGITRDPNSISQKIEGDWFYDQIGLGFNYRMPDILAALGQSQLKKLDSFLASRRKIVSHYDELLDQDSFRPLSRDRDAESSWHLFVVSVLAPNQRKLVFDHLRSNGVLVNVHYRPIYQQSFYRSFGKYNMEDFPGAEQYYQTAISLPIFPDLGRRKVEEIVQILGGRMGHQVIF